MSLGDNFEQGKHFEIMSLRAPRVGLILLYRRKHFIASQCKDPIPLGKKKERGQNNRSSPHDQMMGGRRGGK